MDWLLSVTIVGVAIASAAIFSRGHCSYMLFIQSPKKSKKKINPRPPRTMLTKNTKVYGWRDRFHSRHLTKPYYVCMCTIEVYLLAVILIPNLRVCLQAIVRLWSAQAHIRREKGNTQKYYILVIGKYLCTCICLYICIYFVYTGTKFWSGAFFIIYSRNNLL